MNPLRKLSAHLCLTAALILSLAACGHEAVPVSVPEFWQQTSVGGSFEVTLDPQTDEKVEMNEFLEWVVTVATPDGEPVAPARITVGGGMPAHGHGLPSQPKISDHPEAGKYLLKGLKFSMNGQWVIELDIQSESIRDTVKFDIALDF